MIQKVVPQSLEIDTKFLWSFIENFQEQLKMSDAYTQDKINLMKDSDTSPIYSGLDMDTKEKEYCWNCGETPKKLLRCGRCQMAWYCNRSCQKMGFSEHKKECKHAFECKQELEARRQELEYMELYMGEGPENAFETSVGNFWGILKTRDYMRARSQIIQIILHLAYKIETKSLWSSVLHHQLDMLRLCVSDNLGIRDEVPPVLLALNRDDDCCKFIRWWILALDERDIGELEPWVTNVKTDLDRYGDPTEGKENSHVDLSHLVALLVVKMRLVAAYETHEKVIHNILPFDDLVRENVVKISVCDDIDKQKALRNKYLQMIHKHNKHMLPGFVDPHSMNDMKRPNYYCSGDISEALMYLDPYCRHILRIPGSQKVIEDFLKG